MTEDAAVGDAKRVVRSRMREVRACHRRRSSGPGAALGVDLRPVDRARLPRDWPRRPSSCTCWSSSRSPANPTSRRSAHGAPPTRWRRTDRSSTATPCSSTRQRRPGGPRRRRRPRPRVHAGRSSTRPGRRPLRPLPSPAPWRLRAHRRGVRRATRRRPSHLAARHRRRRRHHLLSPPSRDDDGCLASIDQCDSCAGWAVVGPDGDDRFHQSRESFVVDL